MQRFFREILLKQEEMDSRDMKNFRMEIRRTLLIIGAVKLSDSLIIAKLRVENPIIFFRQNLI